MEVQKEAHALSAEAEIGEKLRPMYIRERAYCLDFHDHAIVNQYVHTILEIHPFTGILHGERDLRGHLQSPSAQLRRKEH